jgi:CMP-N-acetylneuraminic acid synthetase
MKRLAVIPARGGSKRIRARTCWPFAGRPIIAL